MLSKDNKLSTLQLMLMSTGGMIGAGWLFSPYYGFQTAGVGVLLSWLVVALITLIIGIAFAEVIAIAPIVGGLSRFIGITHNRTVSFVFLSAGWLSYVVYLPLETQSAIQYLSFWYPNLVVQHETGATLSHFGLMVALVIMVFLTWFNSFLLKNVARANSAVSVWKILVPFGIAIALITMFGDWGNVERANIKHDFSIEAVLLAITSSGMAFAFTGFQNGLILANSSENPRRAMPYSLFAPILIGFVLYSSLSLIYIVCLGDKELTANAAAPMLSLVVLFGVHIIVTLLFIDAVIAPLGTANVYTATTSRILYGLSKDFFPKSFLNKLNKFSSPSHCLWVNAVVGACFLLPFPTWSQLVDFLSSIVVFSYLAGPVSLIVLRQELPHLERSFKVVGYKLVGYTGFACCSLMIYWSSINNLIYLAVLTAVLIVVHNLFIEKKTTGLFAELKNNFFITAYLLAMLLVKYLHHKNIISFPVDNFLIVIASSLACKMFIDNRSSKKEIEAHLHRVMEENNK